MRQIPLATEVLLFVFALPVFLSPVSGRSEVWKPAPGHTQVLIWPGSPPGEQAVTGPESMEVRQNRVGGKPWVAVKNVTQPTLTVYSPQKSNTGVAVIVFPGGGYHELAIDLEGTEICEMLAAKGITAVLLKYRAPTPKVGRYRESPLALQDAQRTLGLVRSHAAEWHIDSAKIGVIGFSAGGHLVAAISTHYDQRSYLVIDSADQVSCRPDFAIALYPGHLSPWYPDDPGAWKGTDRLGLNPNILVTSNTPPTFLLQAQNDPVDDVRNSMVYSLALRNAKVPVELHLYAEGGHAFGVRRTKYPITDWPQLVDKWLQTIGIVSK